MDLMQILMLSMIGILTVVFLALANARFFKHFEEFDLAGLPMDEFLSAFRAEVRDQLDCCRDYASQRRTVLAHLRPLCDYPVALYRRQPSLAGLYSLNLFCLAWLWITLRAAIWPTCSFLDGVEAFLRGLVEPVAQP